MRAAPNALKSAGPPHWHTSSSKSSWISEDGYLTSVASNQTSSILFDTPVTGVFEFTVEARPSVSGTPGYGGLLFQPGSNQVQSIVTGDTIQLAHEDANQAEYYSQGQFGGFNAFQGLGGRWPEGMKTGDFGRLTIQVAPGKIRCLTDGKLFYEDLDPAPTSPWLMLSGFPGATIYRNVLSQA